MSSVARWVRVADAQRLEDEQMVEVVVDGLSHPVVVYRVDGELFATDGICTHGQASLVDGWLEGHVIECPLHGGCFDVRTGCGMGPPVDADLATYPVRLQDGTIELDLSAAQ